MKYQLVIEEGDYEMKKKSLEKFEKRYRWVNICNMGINFIFMTMILICFIIFITSVDPKMTKDKMKTQCEWVCDANHHLRYRFKSKNESFYKMCSFPKKYHLDHLPCYISKNNTFDCYVKRFKKNIAWEKLHSCAEFQYIAGNYYQFPTVFEFLLMFIPLLICGASSFFAILTSFSEWRTHTKKDLLKLIFFSNILMIITCFQFQFSKFNPQHDNPITKIIIAIIQILILIIGIIDVFIRKKIIV